jgi:hypothetical protein
MTAGPKAPPPKEDDPNSKSTKSLADIVPSVYYDLIARICPGAGFWITLSIGSSEVRKVYDLEKAVGASLVLFILISYLAGIVLSGFCLVWDALSYKLLSALKSLHDPLGLTKTGITKQWQVVAEKMESVAKVSQDPGRIVTKALAEVALCQNLLSGLFVLLAIGACSDGKHFFDPRAYWLTYSIVAIVLFISMLFRQAMFLGRAHAIYQMYVEKETA